MIKANKKQFFLALFIILFLFVISFIVFYFFSKNNFIESNLEIEFIKGGQVNLNNTLPVSDELGKNYDGVGSSENVISYSEFYIKNETDKDQDYEIFLTKNTVNVSEISEKYIKLYLTDEKNNSIENIKNLLPVYSNLGALNDKPDGNLLYRGKIKANSLKRFKLRVWLSDTYVINKEEEVFSFKINFRAI